MQFAVICVAFVETGDEGGAEIRSENRKARER
jgi:hypothetical protein